MPRRPSVSTVLPLLDVVEWGASCGLRELAPFARGAPRSSWSLHRPFLFGTETPVVCTCPGLFPHSASKGPQMEPRAHVLPTWGTRKVVLSTGVGPGLTVPALGPTATQGGVSSLNGVVYSRIPNLGGAAHTGDS